MHKASSLQCIHFADDATLFTKGNNLEDLIDLTNTELVKMDKWVCANKLSHNINKTAFAICSTKSITDVHRVKIRNVEINLVYNYRFISENKGRLGEFIMDIFLGHNEDNFLKFLTRAFVNICC